jgi:hypothetical protein
MSDTIVDTGDGLSESDTLELKLRKETEAQKTLRLRKAWEAVCSTPEGRAVLWDIMSTAGMNATPLVPGVDALTFANIGRADHGRELNAKINQVGKRWALLMLQENL